MREISVEEAQAGQRLDRFLQKYMPKAPKSFFYRMLRKKNITCNRKKCDGGERLAAGDVIQLFLSEDTIEGFREAPEEWPVTELSIVYEDAHAALIRKPSGMLSQKAGPEDVSLVEYFIGYLLKKGETTREALRSFRPSVCNRLDRNTSGLVAAGKDQAALRELSALFRERKIRKLYLCVVCGDVKKGERLSGWILKDGGSNQSAVFEEPREGSSRIETAYRPLSSNGRFTLLEVELITGKSHQIRAHLAAAGHPILGDPKYGDPEANRYGRERYRVKSQLLHAWSMEFPVLSGPLSGLSKRTVTALPPEPFMRTMSGEGLSKSERVREMLYGDLG